MSLSAAEVLPGLAPPVPRREKGPKLCCWSCPAAWEGCPAIVNFPSGSAV